MSGIVRRCIGLALSTYAFVAFPVAAHAQGPNARAVLPGYDTPILLDTLGIASPIAGNRDSIFTALTTVFAALKIPVEQRDPRAGMLHNLNAEVLRRLGNTSLSVYFDCGRGFSGNNADVYRITLAVSAWVEPASGDPRRLHVAIAASARDPSGSRSAYAPCASRGALEDEIVKRVKRIIGDHT